MESEDQNRHTSYGFRGNRFQAYEGQKRMYWLLLCECVAPPWREDPLDVTHANEVSHTKRNNEGSNSLKHVDKEQLFMELQNVKEENNGLRSETHRLKIKLMHLEVINPTFSARKISLATNALSMATPRNPNSRARYHHYLVWDRVSACSNYDDKWNKLAMIWNESKWNSMSWRSRSKWPSSRRCRYQVISTTIGWT